MLSTVDIMPTVLGLMGLGDQVPSTVQGKDFSRELISGEWASRPKPKSALFLGYNNQVKGVRTDRYSFQIDQDGEQLLVDNQADPYQMTPRSLDDIDPADAEMIRTELGRWLKESDDPWCRDRKFPEIIRYPA